MGRQSRSKIIRTLKFLLVIATQIICGDHSVLATSDQSAHLNYDVRYTGANDPRVTVQLSSVAPLPAPLALVIPRTYPGGYTFVPYDDFVEDVHAFGADGKSLECKKDPFGPRWDIGQKDQVVSRIQYQINIQRMEDQIEDSVESSKIRKGYALLLGYSVFAYIDGMRQNPVTLQVHSPADWPVLSTLDPQVDALKGTTTASAPSYDRLADSQIVMGPDLQFRKLDGKIGLIMAVYSEGEEDVDGEAKLAREALDRIQEYFGDTPFLTYTALVELLQPHEGHKYNFSQEHDTSGTFSLSVENATNAHAPDYHHNSAIFNYAHHMSHCWVPKRVWGVGYKPFNWELTPVIETIWFNEGFARYATLQAITAAEPQADRKTRRDRLNTRTREALNDAPTFIKQMTLPLLSQEASFLYAKDFRLGINVFNRGFMMAAEIDDRIQSQTQGKKSLRDGFHGLLTWSAEKQRAFQVEEMTKIISDSTGVDIHEIVARWMAAQSN